MSAELDFSGLDDAKLAEHLAVVEADDAWVNSELELLRMRKRENSNTLEALRREHTKREKLLEWKQKQAEIAKLLEDPEIAREQAEFVSMLRSGHATWDFQNETWKVEPFRTSLRTPSGFVFIHERVSEKDVESLLGDFEPEDVVVRIDDSWTMANIVVQIGLFPSFTQARKNGHHHPIPQGFSQHVMGKKKIQVFILNRFGEKPLDSQDEID